MLEQVPRGRVNRSARFRFPGAPTRDGPLSQKAPVRRLLERNGRHPSAMSGHQNLNPIKDIRNDARRYEHS
jgi:hypothetical protein